MKQVGGMPQCKSQNAREKARKNWPPEDSTTTKKVVQWASVFARPDFVHDFFCRPTQCKSRQCHAFVCGGDRVKRQKIWKMGSNPCSGGHRLDHVWLPSTCHGYGPAAFDIASHFGHEASVTDGSRPRTMKRKCQHLSTWEACASWHRWWQLYGMRLLGASRCSAKNVSCLAAPGLVGSLWPHLSQVIHIPLIALSPLFQLSAAGTPGLSPLGLFLLCTQRKQWKAKSVQPGGKKFSVPSCRSSARSLFHQEQKGKEDGHDQDKTLVLFVFGFLVFAFLSYTVTAQWIVYRSNSVLFSSHYHYD